MLRAYVFPDTTDMGSGAKARNKQTIHFTVCTICGDCDSSVIHDITVLPLPFWGLLTIIIGGVLALLVVGMFIWLVVQITRLRPSSSPDSYNRFTEERASGRRLK